MLYSKWNSLSLNTRVQIATAFGVAKIGPTHVFNNTIQSDGFKFQDVEKAITVEKLQEYLNTKETDFDTLWTMLVDKTEGRVPMSPEIKEVEKILEKGVIDASMPKPLLTSEKPKRKYTKRAK